MVSIKWCLEQHRGIELVEPNEDISQSYLSDADDSIEAMHRNTGKWKIVTGYYACYNALYALCMKTGIKSEIHDCTISLMDFFGFEPKDKQFITQFKKDRIDVQYYLKPAKPPEEAAVKSFVVKCKLLINKLNDAQIKIIRRIIENG